MATPSARAPRDPWPSADLAVDAFRKRFGERPTVVVRAPGRVNLIGEHTDYNDGFVLPIAIDRWVTIAIRARIDGCVLLRSLDFDEESMFAIADLGTPQRGWIEYAKAMAWALSDAGHRLSGFEGVVAGDVPVGAGLSSSAALELAMARAFAEVSEIGWDPVAMARTGQRAENDWIGVKCGIMDQLISAGGKAGNALLIDCRSLEMRPVPLPSKTAVVVLDTSTRRQLAGSEYNDRRAQCSAAAAACGATSLRDVKLGELEASRETMDDLVFRRARHVLTENTRTQQASEAMRRNDAAALGGLMTASHQSLRDDFEVSTSVMDTMVEIALRAPGCLGARMTGAGFGGCAIALVSRDRVSAFVDEVALAFQGRTGLAASIYSCEAVDGAEAMGDGAPANIA